MNSEGIIIRLRLYLGIVVVVLCMHELWIEQNGIYFLFTFSADTVFERI